MVVFATLWHESATGAHVSPHLEHPLPPPSPPQPSGLSQSTVLSALPLASNWHWSSILHMVTHMSHAVLSNHPTLAFSHRVQKSVLYICISFTALHKWSSLPSSKFHIYASIFCIGVPLSDWLYCIWWNCHISFEFSSISSASSRIIVWGYSQCLVMSRKRTCFYFLFSWLFWSYF